MRFLSLINIFSFRTRVPGGGVGSFQQQLIGGWNAANAVELVPSPPPAVFINMVKNGLKAPLLRFPGGTIAMNWAWDPAAIHRMAIMAAVTNSAVIWVADVFDTVPAPPGNNGTAAEKAVAAIRIFLDHGVQVVGVELGNEAYLNQYDLEPEQYVEMAFAIYGRVNDVFPGIPMTLAIGTFGPIADRSPEQQERIDAYNDVMFAQQHWVNGYVLHCYTDAVTEAGVYQYPGFLLTTLGMIAERTARPVWITEFNVFATGPFFGTAVQAQFYKRVMKVLRGNRQVPIATAHNLIAQGIGYNAIRRQGSVYSFTTLGAMAVQVAR